MGSVVELCARAVSGTAKPITTNQTNRFMSFLLGD
jgi:hypothetical protein